MINVKKAQMVMKRGEAEADNQEFTETKPDIATIMDPLIEASVLYFLIDPHHEANSDNSRLRSRKAVGADASIAKCSKDNQNHPDE